MQAAGLAYLVWLLAGLAVIAAAWTLRRSTVARRNKRRARGFFVLGFLCGVSTGVMLKRRRAFHAIGPAFRRFANRRRWPEIRIGTEHFAARALAVAVARLPLPGSSR
jgi:hypothetical protein